MCFDWSKRSNRVSLERRRGEGAYEIGCWRGLLENGISEFTAIAGTSIGGLNGYFIGKGELENAEKHWRDLGRNPPLRRSILRIGLGFVERLGRAVISAITTYVFLPLVEIPRGRLRGTILTVPITDTSPSAQVVQLQIQRAMPGEQRLLMALEMSQFARELARERIRRDHPEWPETRVARELMRLAFLPAPMPARLR